MVYEDFYDYYGNGAKGVYSHKYGELGGGHCVSIVGCGYKP